jgi:hypothetical protein
MNFIQKHRKFFVFLIILASLGLLLTTFLPFLSSF